MIGEVFGRLTVVALNSGRYGSYKHWHCVCACGNEVDKLSVEVRDYISQSKGMARMAWAVWTILSGGMGMMLAKLFFFMGQ